MGVPIPPKLHHHLTAARRFLRRNRFWLGLAAFVVLGLAVVRLVGVAPEESCYTIFPSLEQVEGPYWRLYVQSGADAQGRLTYYVFTLPSPPPFYIHAPGYSYVLCWRDGKIVRHYNGYAGEDTVWPRSAGPPR